MENINWENLREAFKEEGAKVKFNKPTEKFFIIEEVLELIQEAKSDTCEDVKLSYEMSDAHIMWIGCDFSFTTNTTKKDAFERIINKVDEVIITPAYEAEKVTITLVITDVFDINVGK